MDSTAEHGSRVLAIANDPRWGSPPTRTPAKCLAAHTSKTWDLCTLPRNKAFPYPDPQSLAVADSSAQLLDLTDYYCTADTCPAEINNVVVYRDLHHVTATYARTLGPAIDAGIHRAVSR